MADASFPVQVTCGMPIVTVPEEIDFVNATGLRAALVLAAAHGNGTTVVDMSRTHFCDVAGLHVLTRAHKQAESEGGEIVMVVSAGTVQRILALTGIDRLIRSFSSLDEAMAQLRAGLSVESSGL
jgi:anti-anti-sigma factor